MKQPTMEELEDSGSSAGSKPREETVATLPDVDKTPTKAKIEKNTAEENCGDDQREEDTKSDDGSDKGSDEGSETPQKAMTRVGIEYSEDQKRKHADWSVRDIEPTPQSQLSGKFDIAVALNGDITLMSPFLVSTFRRVVKYFPGTLNESATFVIISKPYAALYHYWDDFRAAIEAEMEGMVDLSEDGENNDDAIAEQPDTAVEKKDTTATTTLTKERVRLQLDNLCLVYERFCATGHAKARELIEDGLVSFKNLWALYKPGDLLLSKDGFSEPVLHSFTACALRTSMNFRQIMALGMSGNQDNIRNSNPGVWNIDGWRTQWDGSTLSFTRLLKTFSVNYFPGARTITSIEPYPLRFYADGCEGQTLITKLIERGEKWRKLITLPPTCQVYQGPAFKMKGSSRKVARDRTNLHDRVIVHHDGYNEFCQDGTKFAEETMEPMVDMMDQLFGNKPCVPVITDGYDDRYDQFDHHSPETPFDDLQKILSPSAIGVYSITTRSWYHTTVGLLRDIQWRTSAIDGLVLEKSTKDMIQALVAQHNDSRGNFVEDFIEGKGKGLVILLHGNPGVGKTLTAESVAEYTQKPLLAINIGEMSVEANVERQLKIIFRQASVWDAVLLLDEADVVLEERSYEDMKRNALVSVFLRMIEYYPGILFMTTNRIRTMDRASQSRIHMAVQYDDLNKDLRRQIWKNIVDRLPEGNSEELKGSLTDLAGWKLNGRQIRNVFLVAQSIALKENKPLAYEHLKQVIRKTLEFQHFFRDAHEAVRTNLGTNWTNPNDYEAPERGMNRGADGRNGGLAVGDRHSDRRNRRNGHTSRDNDSEGWSDRESDRDDRRVMRSRW